MSFGPEQVANELAGYAKRIYDEGVIDQEQRITPTYDELPTKQWNIRGANWFGDAHLQRSSSFRFSTSTQSLPQETTEVSQQFNIQRVEQFGDAAFTKDFLVRLVKGVSSFGDYMTKVEDLVKSGKKNMNQSCYIGPSMARALLTSSPVASSTFTVDNFQYLFLGMYIDIYTGTTLSVNNVQITNINFNTNTITVSPAVTATAGDTIYLHEENQGGSANLGFNSLLFQCDDGTDFPVTFEGISRTTFATWRGNRIDFAGAPLTNDALQQMQNNILIFGGNDYQTENYVNFVHPTMIRRYLSIILPQKRYIDASKYDSGMEKPNMLEWNGKPLVIDPDAPKRDWIMYNRNFGGKVELVPFSVDATLGGTTMKWKSGFMQGIVVTYFSGALGTEKCNAHAWGKNFIPLS